MIVLEEIYGNCIETLRFGFFKDIRPQLRYRKALVMKLCRQDEDALTVHSQGELVPANSRGQVVGGIFSEMIADRPQRIRV